MSDTTITSTFNFNVNKLPLKGPNGQATPLYGLFRDDTNEVVVNQAVSSLYVPHTVEDVISLRDAAAEAFDGIEDTKTQCYFKRGHQVVFQPTRQARIEACQNDTVFPRIIISANYNRAFTASLGFYRDLCTNLTILRQVQGITVNIRHTSGLRHHMDELISDFRNLSSGLSNLEEVIHDLESRKVRMADFVRAVFGAPPEEAGVGQTLAVRRIEAIFSRLNRERRATGQREVSESDDFTCSAWSAFQAVQGYLQHDTNRRGSNVTPQSRIFTTLSDSRVARAERAAFELSL